MNFKQAFRRLFFKEIDAELDILNQLLNKQIELVNALSGNLTVLGRESEAQTKIVLNLVKILDASNVEQGLTVEYPRKIIIPFEI